MTLHDTTELLKKAGIGSTIGVISILLIVISVRIGISIKNSLYPPLKDPPTQAFGPLAPLQFPESIVKNNFTYTLQTLSGSLPTDLPDRLAVFPIIESAPNFLNVETAKRKVASLNLLSESGGPVPGIQLPNDPYYEWDEQRDFYRKITMNINSFDFEMTSSYLSSLTVLSGKFISDEQSAINIAVNYLNGMGLMPKDIDLTKTTTQNNPEHYVTYPQLYSIKNEGQSNVLVPATKLADAKVIRVDLYQKDVEYELTTGVKEGEGQKTPLKLPILYPNLPYSNMGFWVASGPSSAMVTEAYFTYKKIDFSPLNANGDKIDATYAIKTIDQAYAELKDGKAYIPTYWGNDNNIFITNVYLAYYLARDSKGYLMPIYVFEGKNGFFAYVSALAEATPAETTPKE